MGNKKGEHEMLLVIAAIIVAIFIFFFPVMSKVNDMIIGTALKKSFVARDAGLTLSVISQSPYPLEYNFAEESIFDDLNMQVKDGKIIIAQPNNYNPIYYFYMQDQTIPKVQGATTRIYAVSIAKNEHQFILADDLKISPYEKKCKISTTKLSDMNFFIDADKDQNNKGLFVNGIYEYTKNQILMDFIEPKLSILGATTSNSRSTGNRNIRKDTSTITPLILNSDVIITIKGDEGDDQHITLVYSDRTKELACNINNELTSEITKVGFVKGADVGEIEILIGSWNNANVVNLYSQNIADAITRGIANYFE